MLIIFKKNIIFKYFNINIKIYKYNIFFKYYFFLNINTIYLNI